jgi:hypothetical protein
MELAEPIVDKLPSGRITKTAAVTAAAELKSARPRRGRSLLTLARKLLEMGTLLVQMIIKDQAGHDAEVNRLKGICEVVFNGAFATMLKNSPLLSAEDKDFLKDMNWL